MQPGENDDSSNRPRTPHEFGDWFAETTEDERQRFANFHGDVTADRRGRTGEGGECDVFRR